MFHGRPRVSRPHRVEEIMAQTQPLPKGAQWGVLHDELTWRSQPTKSTNYMYSEYAEIAPGLKRNLGISKTSSPHCSTTTVGWLMQCSRLRSCLRRQDGRGRQHLPRRERDAVRTPNATLRPRRRVGTARLYLPPLVDSQAVMSKGICGTPVRSFTGCSAWCSQPRSVHRVPSRCAGAPRQRWRPSTTQMRDDEPEDMVLRLQPVEGRPLSSSSDS